MTTKRFRLPFSALASVLIATHVWQPSSAEPGAAPAGCPVSPDSPVIYVNTAAVDNGDGSSWHRAHRNLHDALAAAQARPGAEQIWVARGTYLSGHTGYSLPPTVRILGGFSGREQHPGQRDLGRNVTVLSGGGATLHVLTALGTRDVQISDVTVTGGAALGALEADTLDIANEVRGGGLFAVDSQIALCNVAFVDNHARKFGGAVFQRGGTLDIARALFAGNTVLRGPDEVHDDDSEADTDGGAIAIHEAERLRLISSELRDNLAGDDGGALASRRTNVEIVGSSFVRNKGIALIRPVVLGPGVSPHDILISSMGGALQIWNEYLGFGQGDQSRTTVIRDSEFVENAAAIAGAAYIESAPGSTTLINNSRFIRNGGDGLPDPNAPPNEQGVTQGRSGGAIMAVSLRWGDRVTDADGNFVRPQHRIGIEDSLFRDNSAGYGGAMQLIGMDGQITNSVFTGNVARQRAGAVLTSNLIALFDQLGGQRPGLGSLRIAESTFIGNRALGIAENLLNEDFPGLVMDSEQPYGGGALFNEGSYDLEVTDSLFAANSATNSDGGAVHNAAIHVGIFAFAAPPAPTSYGATLRVRRSAFVGNAIVGNGSGAAIVNGGSQTNGAIFDRDGNDARDGAAGADAHIEDCVLALNVAARYGGALANWNASRVRVVNSTLAGNAAAIGAAIASIGRPTNAAELQVAHSEVLNNHASGQGGGIFARDTAGEAVSSTVSGNTPTDVDWQ